MEIRLDPLVQRRLDRRTNHQSLNHHQSSSHHHHHHHHHHHQSSIINHQSGMNDPSPYPSRRSGLGRLMARRWRVEHSLLGLGCAQTHANNVQTAFRARLDPCFARQGSFKTHMGPSREPQGPPRDPCFARQGAFKTRMGPQAAHLVGPAPSANTLPAGCRGPKRPSKVMYFGVLFLKSVLVGFWGRFCSILRAVWHQFWINLHITKNHDFGNVF